MQLKELKKGEYFRIVTNGKQGRKVYIKDDYYRPDKKYLCIEWEDAGGSGKLFKPTQEITTEFEF